MDTAIDWRILADALSYYEELGYRRVEASWFVPMSVQMLTCPHEDYVLSVPGHGALIGSSEQSFIDMTLRDALAPGRYVALTPCFRNEVEDMTHSRTFMKVELFVSGSDPDDALIREAGLMRQRAATFMRGRCGVEPDVITTACGEDLELYGVEVGSYGVRSAAGIHWAYGTGLAEPRFSYAASLKSV